MFPYRCKRLQCYDKVNEEQRAAILQHFLNFTSKDEQDTHLSSLISYQNIQQRRPRINRDNEASFQHDLAYYYRVRILSNMKIIPVCAIAFLSIHGISRNRLRTIQTKISSGSLQKDLRGTHETRPHKVPLELENLIKCHIKSFKARQSHYSLRDNPNVSYLPEELTVTKMFELFLNETRICISYRVYYNIFTHHFNIKFGLPRSDTCSICDELNLKIKCATDQAKNELITQKKLHLCKAKKFKDLKKAYKEKARLGECMVLTFDFMQNLPLPHIQTSDVFYSRQMWYYVFGIHDLANDDVSMYCYTETTAKKGASDVTSLLLHYLNNRQITSEHLILLSDGCAGQNKNHIMVYFQYFLVHVLKLFKSVKHIFPIRGHTYLPNDSDFALIGNKKKKFSPEVPSDWDKIISEVRRYPSPFKVVPVTQDDFFDMKQALTPYFLKTPKPALKLRQARVITTKAEFNYIKIKLNFSGPSFKSEIRKRQNLPNELTLNPLYTTAIELTAGKKANLINLSKYLSCAENREYYINLCGGDELDDEDDVEVDEDDNSDGCEE